VGAEEAGVTEILHAFPFIWHNPGLLLGRVGQQLVISAIAMAIALVIALPLGVWLGHLHRWSFVAITASNLGRALPSLAVIAILIAPLGIGRSTLIVALVVLAAPVMLTNAYTAVDGVSPDVVDAARGMGMRESQILAKAELPLALPLLFAGIRTAAVYVVATVPLGAIVGTDGGLGDIIANQASYRFSGVLGAAICVAALALAVDAVFALVQRALTPRGIAASTAADAVATAGAMGDLGAAIPV
jgi:osmoprotectant transport system permease protein